MIWSREIEGGTFATPERRAALEARIGELTNGIRDEVVRRYYRQDLAERLQRCSRPKAAAAAMAGAISAAAIRRPRQRIRPPICPARLLPRARPAGSPPRRPGRRHASQTIDRGPYQAASPQLANSPIMRGQRSAMSRREALILQSLINHPWLLHDHLEEVAALELAHPEANKLRAGIIAAFAGDHHHSPDVEEQAEKMRADLEARGFSQVLQRVETGDHDRGGMGRARSAPRARTFFPPGSNSLPCIRKPTPYLGK